MLILVLISLLGTGFGHFMGTVAFKLGKPQLAVPFTMVMPVLCMHYLYFIIRSQVIVFPMFLFAGLLVNFNNWPDYLLWLQYISVFYYGFALVSINQWKNYGNVLCPANQASPITGHCAFATGQTVLAYFGLNQNDQTRDILIVVAMLIFFRVGCFIMLVTMKRGR